jgi:hypothetical protein
MNRLLTILILSIPLFLTSCIRDEYLDPIQLPTVVNDPVYRVDRCSENEFVAIGESGLYLQLAQNDYVEYDAEEIEYLNEQEFKEARMSYQSDNLLVTSGRKWMMVSRSGIQEGQFGFMFRPSSILSPNGIPMHIGFGDLQENPQTGEIEYKIFIERIENGQSVRIETDMMVPNSTYGSVDVTFNNANQLVITTNPVFVLSDWDTDCEIFTTLNPSSGFVDYKTIQKPTVAGDAIYGFDVYPQPSTPIQNAIKFDLNTNQVSSFSPSLLCNYPSTAQGGVKHLGWNLENSYVHVSSNQGFTSEIGMPLSYIHELNMDSRECELIQILSTLDFQSSFDINDIAFSAGSDQVLVATDARLYIYTLSTNSTLSFVETLLLVE